jgi:predicted DNA-binding transcriptional regulator AlpA
MEEVMEKQIVNERQAAQYLGLSVKTLQAWRWRGTGPRYVKMNKAVRYRLGDLDAFTESNVVDPIQ